MYIQRALVECQIQTIPPEGVLNSESESFFKRVTAEALRYVSKSRQMVSYGRQEHSSLSTWKYWPVRQHLSRSAATCILQISGSTGLISCPD